MKLQLNLKLKTASHVKLMVYDAIGQMIDVLVDEPKMSGKYSVIFNLNEFKTGTYFYCLETNENIISKRMIYIKD